MTPPYSLEQARYLQENYKGFVGAEFDERHVLVEDIAIVPFDQASRQRFILYYMVMGRQAQEIVLQEYKGLLFDVMVIARNDSGGVVHKDLASYICSSVAVENGPQPEPDAAVPRLVH